MAVSLALIVQAVPAAALAGEAAPSAGSGGTAVEEVGAEAPGTESADNGTGAADSDGGTSEGAMRAPGEEGSGEDAGAPAENGDEAEDGQGAPESPAEDPAGNGGAADGAGTPEDGGAPVEDGSQAPGDGAPDATDDEAGNEADADAPTTPSAQEPQAPDAPANTAPDAAENALPAAEAAANSIATLASLSATTSLSYDASSGSLTVRAANVSCPTGVVGVSVGVTAPDGTCRWYALSKGSDGTWQARIDPGAFGWQAGTYTVATSITDASWSGNDAGSVRASVSYGKESSAVSVSSNYSTIVATAAGGRVDQAWQVSFQVVGPKGTFWALGTKQADGSYRLEVPASRVGTGTVTVTPVAAVGAASAWLPAATASVPAATAASSLSYNSSAGTLTVNVSDIKCPTGTVGVSAGITAPDGTCRWYALSKNSDGSWGANVKVSDFGAQSGTYTAQISLTDSSWSGISAGSVSTSASIGNGTISASVNASNGTVTLTAKGGAIPLGFNLSFKIDRDGSVGHTGTAWIQATKQSDGSWTATVKESDIGGGTVTAQAVLSVGSATRYLSSTSFSIAGAKGSTSVTDVPASGTISVDVTGVSANSGVSGVSVGVVGNGKERWYALSQTSSGTWHVDVPVADFGTGGATFTFTTYLNDSHGVGVRLGSTSRYISSTKAEVVAEVDGGDGRLWLGVSGGAARYAWGVSFAVTDANGSTRWVAATNNDGNWTVDIPASSVAYGRGTVTAYAHVGADDTVVTLGSDSFTRSTSAARTMASRIMNYSSPTSYLLAIDTSGCRVGVFSGYQGHWEEVAFWACSPGAASTPTVTGVFSVGEKGYYFDSYGSRCFYYTQFYGDYLFHSILYYPSGGIMDSRLGQNLSHGCVRLATENAKWIYSNIPTGTTVVSY